MIPLMIPSLVPLPPPFSPLSISPSELIVAGGAISAGAGLATSGVYSLTRIRDRHIAREGFWLTITPPEKVDADASLAFWKNMRQMLSPWWKRTFHGQPYLIWELRMSAHRPELAIWAPSVVSRQTLSNAIEAAWHGSKVTNGADYKQVGTIAEARLKPLERHLHSIHVPDADEYLRGLIGAAAKLTGDESIVVSVLARPERHPIHRKRQSDPYPRMTNNKPSVLVPVPAYCMNVRISVASTDRARAKERIHGIALAFGSFEGANRLHRYRSDKPAREFHHHHYVSTEELAGLAPMPNATVMRTGRLWEVVADETVPREGKVIGTSGGRPVAQSVADSLMHTIVTGSTGSGKTTMLVNMILQDIEDGRSVVVTDWAKGDMIDWILERYPVGREKDLCLINPTHPTHAVGLDVLSHTIADLSVEHAINYFSELWMQLGDQQEAWLRSTILALSYIPGATLMEIPTFLDNDAWRRRVMDELQTPDSPSLLDHLKATFFKYDEMTPAEQKRAVGPLTHKLRSFLLKSTIRFVLGQSYVTKDPFKTLEHGGVILARVPKSEIGGKQASLLSSIVAAKTWEQVMSRSHIPEKDRYPTSFYGDEIHNYLRGSQFHSIEDMLTEARGWGMGVVLAHQFFEQITAISPETAAAISSCCRTKITFKISRENAHAAARTFEPMTENDIAKIPEYSAICLPVYGTPYSFKTVPLGAGSKARKEEVTRIAMKNWGRPKDDIEQEIIARRQNPARVLRIGAKYGQS